LSVGPLGFNKKIRRVDLKFISTPESSIIASREMSKRLRQLTRVSSDLENVIMLPYSKVNPDKDAVDY